jgi:hypothetical protein
VKLIYFSTGEFGIWWPFMDHELLEKLDEFRARWGERVLINHPNSGGLGRVGADNETSQHYAGPSRSNIVQQVRAADITPTGIEAPNGLQRAYRIAHEVGFHGIGLYPPGANWSSPGLHVDVRQDRQPGNPATWSRINNDAARRSLGLTDDDPRYVARELALQYGAWSVG